MAPKAFPDYGPPNPLTCVPGPQTETTVQIAVFTLADPAINPVTLTVNGAAYVSGVNFTLTARGTPTVFWSGAITITGLTKFTRYPWQVAQAGQPSDSGSCVTAPTVTDRFRVAHVSCDFNGGLTIQWSGDAAVTAGNWQHIEASMQDSSNSPLAAVIFVDDLGYVDTCEIKDDGSAYAFAGQSGLATTAQPRTSGALNDYLIAWAAMLGMIGPTQTGYSYDDIFNDFLYRALWGREVSRAYVRKNASVWAQLGDHEFNNDVGWDIQPTGAVFTSGKAAWEATYGLLSPPLSGVVTRRDTTAKHWSAKLGPLTILAPDGVTNASRTWDGNAVYGQSSTLTQFTTIYGNNQIDDLLESVQTLNSPFTLLVVAHSGRYIVARTGSTNPKPFTTSVTEQGFSAQHPIYDHCVADWQRLFTRTGATPPSLMDNGVSNGALGQLVVLHGDDHHAHVMHYKNAAYTGNAAEKFVWITGGTVGGSFYFSNDASVVEGATIADCEVLYQHNNTSDSHCALLEYVPGAVRQLSANLIDSLGATVWGGKFIPCAGNNPLPATFVPEITVIRTSDDKRSNE